MANSLKFRGAETQNRTGDTRIFSPLLYRLSYLGTSWDFSLSEKFVKEKKPKILITKPIWGRSSILR